MLPDFSKAKARARRDLLRFVQEQVPIIAPLLKDVATFVQHEGRGGQLTRVDDSTATISFRRSEGSLTLSREEQKSFDPAVIRQKLVDTAQQIAEDLTRHMFRVVEEAAEEVGNVVDAGGELTQEKYLEIFRKVEMDFDPKTLKLAPGFRWVMHPDVAAKVIPKVQEWEKDPAFNAAYERIITIKREEWRDREARRKLVD